MRSVRGEGAPRFSRPQLELEPEPGIENGQLEPLVPGADEAVDGAAGCDGAAGRGTAALGVTAGAGAVGLSTGAGAAGLGAGGATTGFGAGAMTGLGGAVTIGFGAGAGLGAAALAIFFGATFFAAGFLAATFAFATRRFATAFLGAALRTFFTAALRLAGLRTVLRAVFRALVRRAGLRAAAFLARPRVLAFAGFFRRVVLAISALPLSRDLSASLEPRVPQLDDASCAGSKAC